MVLPHERGGRRCERTDRTLERCLQYPRGQHGCGILAYGGSQPAQRCLEVSGIVGLRSQVAVEIGPCPPKGVRGHVAGGLFDPLNDEVERARHGRRVVGHAICNGPVPRQVRWHEAHVVLFGDAGGQVPVFASFPAPRLQRRVVAPDLLDDSSAEEGHARVADEIAIGERVVHVPFEGRPAAPTMVPSSPRPAHHA